MTEQLEAPGTEPSQGCALIDVSFPFAPYDEQFELRSLEYIHDRIFEIAPALPRRVTGKVGFVGTAHNPQPIPALLLFDPLEDPKDWDAMEVLEIVQHWIDRQDPRALRDAIESSR